MLQCPNCRTVAPAGSRFCNGCGLPLTAPDENTTVQGMRREVAPDPHVTVHGQVGAGRNGRLPGAPPADPNATVYGRRAGFGDGPQNQSQPPDPHATIHGLAGARGQAPDPPAPTFGQPGAGPMDLNRTVQGTRRAPGAGGTGQAPGTQAPAWHGEAPPDPHATWQGQRAPAPNHQYPPPGTYAPSGSYGAPGQPSLYPQAALPEERGRKSAPYWLLALAIAVLVGGVGTAAVLVIQSKSKSGVTGAQIPALPSGGGVPLAGAPLTPAGPGVVRAPGLPPMPSGVPVVSAPSGNPDMAPPVIAAPGSRPGAAPSVIAAPRSPQMPGPSPLMAIPQPPQPGAPLTRGVGSPMPRGPSALQNQPPAPQAPRDNRDFERYLAWLRFVENERNRVMREAWSLLGPALGDSVKPPDFDDPNVELQIQRKQQASNAVFQQVLVAIQRFEANIARTKPAVPRDCVDLDQEFVKAQRLNGFLTGRMVQALATVNTNPGAALGIVPQVTHQMDRELFGKFGALAQANRKLQAVFRGRGIEPSFEIDSTSMMGGSGGLGGLSGMLGM